MNDSEEKAEKACRIVGKPYSLEQAEADVMLLPIIGDTIREIEYDVDSSYFNIIFTSRRILRIRAAGEYEFVVELEKP